MLRTLLKGPARKTYCGAGLMLVALSPVYYTHLPYPSEYPGVVCVLSLAVLAFVFAYLQDWVHLTSAVKTRLGWSYGAGSVLMMNGQQWLHDLIQAWVPYDIGKQVAGMIDLVFPLMILFPVATVILAVPSYPRKWPNRAYLMGGLGLVLLFIVEIWFNLFSIHFLYGATLDSDMARLVLMPACLMTGTAGMLLGCLPHWSERPARLESATIFCYLTGAVAMALGLYREDLAMAAPLAAALGVFAPASFLSRRWIVNTFGEGAQPPAQARAQVDAMRALRTQ
jgi:hypothetical protein